MPRIPNTTTFTDFEENVPASPAAAAAEDEDAGPRIILVQHQFSRAQAAYVQARHAEPNAPIFYKDATPRAEHYVRCGIRVEGVQEGTTVPVKLELCFPDGRVVAPTFEPRPGKDADALKVLGDGCKRFLLQPGTPRFFDYRIELGSLRADDRKFCVKISPDSTHVAGVMPAVTPGLLVLSKKRIFPGQELNGPNKRPCVAGSDMDPALLLAKAEECLEKMAKLEESVKTLTATVYAAMHPARPGARPPAAVSTANTPREGLSRSSSFDHGHGPASPRPAGPAMPAPGANEQAPPPKAGLGGFEPSPAAAFGGYPQNAYPSAYAPAPHQPGAYVPPGGAPAPQDPRQYAPAEPAAPDYLTAPPPAQPDYLTAAPAAAAYAPFSRPGYGPQPAIGLPDVPSPPPPGYDAEHADLVEAVRAVGDGPGFPAAAGDAMAGAFLDPRV